MRLILFAPVLALLAACVTSQDPKEVEAVRDFVVVSELEEVDNIRLYDELHYRYLNDYYVAVPSRRGDFLIEFRSQCRALTRRDFTPDMVDNRYDPNIIRAKFDTIRGCRIHKIYAVSEEQFEELEELGDAPGDEVYIPDDAQE